MGSKFTELVIDAASPERLAEFWAAALGWKPTGRYQGVIEIAEPAGGGPSLTFVPVSDEKRGKNRLHIDVNPTGCDQDQEVERLIALGARHADIGQGTDKSWVVLADPEGNEFCVLRDRVERSPGRAARGTIAWTGNVAREDARYGGRTTDPTDAPTGRSSLRGR